MSGLPVTVHYQTADNTATAGSDYVAIPDTVLTINAGNLSAPAAVGNVLVTVNGDTTYEANETFFVNLSSPSGATIADSQGLGTITNDDAAPSFTIDDVTHNEGDAGTTAYVFTVTRTGATALASSVDFTTQNGSATLADTDYQLNTGTLNFTSAQTTQQITVLVNGDTTIEPDEDFTVHLSNASGAAISDADGTGTITNDDSTGVVQFSSATLMQDESQTAVVTVNRTGGTAGTTTVNLSDIGTGSATPGAACGSGADYAQLSPNPRLLTFGPGITQQTVNIPICSDDLPEGSETVNFALSCISNCSLGAIANETLTINDTASTYRSTTPINFVPGSAADQYPSTITVSGAPGVVGSVRVTLYDVSHSLPDNIDILLVGPNGHKYVLMGDAGGSIPIDPLSPVTLTFTDTATSVLPDSTALTTGTFKPTTWMTPVTNFPAPAPVGPYVEPGSTLARPVQQSLFGQFGLVTANGTWGLYVRDDNQVPAPGNAPEGTVVPGSIAGGWGIELLAPTAGGVTVVGRVQTPDGRGLRNARVWMTDSHGLQRSVLTGSFGLYTFDDVPVGESYVIGVTSKQYRFASRLVQVFDTLADVDFTGSE